MRPMPSRAELLHEGHGEVAAKAGLLLLSVALAGLEYFIPRIPLLPWLKPGLANIVTIVWLIRYGTAEALLFAVLRSWIVGFYFGFSLITLTLSMSGALLSTLAMGAAWSMLGARGWLGLAGLGMIGAFAHNTGQLAAMYVLFARNAILLYQIPAMALASAAAGTLVGLLSRSLLAAPSPASAGSVISPRTGTPESARVVACVALLGWSIAVMFVDGLVALGLHALAATVIVQIVTRGSLKALVAPLSRFWLLFVMVICLHLFFSYGQRVPGFAWITYEGLDEAATQSLRLWVWLELSQILKWSGFDVFTMAVLRRLFPWAGHTLTAALVALEYFPDTLDWARSASGPALKLLVRSPREAVRSLAATLHADLVRTVFEGAAQKTPGTTPR